MVVSGWRTRRSEDCYFIASTGSLLHVNGPLLRISAYRCGFKNTNEMCPPTLCLSSCYKHGEGEVLQLEWMDGV